MASDQYMEFNEDEADAVSDDAVEGVAPKGRETPAVEKPYMTIEGNRRLLWSADFADENPAADLVALEKLTARYLDTPAIGEAPFVVRETCGEDTYGRVVPRAATALGRAIQQAREGYGCAVLVDEPDGELHAIVDGPHGLIDMYVRQGGEHAAVLAQKGFPMPIQRVPYGSAWLSFKKAWGETRPMHVADRMDVALGIGHGEAAKEAAPTKDKKPAVNEKQVNGAAQEAQPATDRSKKMNEKGWPIKVKRNFIMSDRATGAPVLKDRVSKAGKPYQTCQVTIPGGTHVVQGGKVVDLSGYQVSLYANKNVMDPEQRDVTLFAAGDVRLFKTDRETGERSNITVAAGALSHAVSQSRKAYQQAHGSRAQERGEAAREKASPAAEKGEAKPAREWHMSAESAAKPATEAQMRKLNTLLEGGAVTQEEVAAVTTKGEASQLITSGLERAVDAPEGYQSASAPTEKAPAPKYDEIQVEDEDILF